MMGQDPKGVRPTALNSPETRFKRTVEATPDLAIFILDLNGNVSGWTQEAERFGGYGADDVVGRHFSAMFTEHDQRLGKPSALIETARTKGRSISEGWRVRKDGTRFWGIVVIDSIHGDSGKLLGFVNVTRDMSMERYPDERFRRVVESAPNAMVMVNADGRIEMVNTEAELVFGYCREEMLGQPVEMLVPPRFREPHLGLRSAFLAAPQTRTMGVGRDLYAVKKDGNEFPVQIGLNPLPSDEGTMILSAIVDITDRKEREQRIEAALKEKDLMLGEIHHRVKNNLQVLYSLLAMQTSNIKDAAAVNVLRESQNRVKSMALIHQRLYESANFAQVDFRDFLEEFIPALLASYGSDPGLIFVSFTGVEARLPISIAIPCGLVVNELVSNALKHAFPDERRGRIEIDLITEPNDIIVLSVSDDGIGIPDDLDLARTGTLGLQLVTSLATQLGAKIAIHRSKPTRFELRFPIAHSG
jgi:PAS domain S-box-containing protein